MNSGEGMQDFAIEHCINYKTWPVNNDMILVVHRWLEYLLQCTVHDL